MYLEGVLVWTSWCGHAFFGLPHWTKHLLVRKRKVRDAFGAARWLWLLLSAMMLDALLDGQIGTLLFGYHPALEWAAQAGCRVSIHRDIQDPMEFGPEQPTRAGLEDIHRSFQHQWFCGNSQLFLVPVFWKPTSHWRVKSWVRSLILHRLDEFSWNLMFLWKSYAGVRWQDCGIIRSKFDFRLVFGTELCDTQKGTK